MNITTPAYVFDISALRKRVKFIKSVLGDKFKLCYAIKANPFLVPDLTDEADCFEACSFGECEICRDIPAGKMVISGVYKEPDRISELVRRWGRGGVFTAESPTQYDLLVRASEECGIVPNVILRLSSGNQFGMDRDTVKSIAADNRNRLNIIGVQLYSGTQKKIEKIVAEAKEFAEFAISLNLKERPRIEYGPGLAVSYFQSDAPRDDKAELTALKEALGGIDAEIVLEMGRFIAAYCGSYHVGIVDVKQTDGINYVITDGGINHLNYYGQLMAMKHPFVSHDRKGEKQNYTVCGALCTTADVLIKNFPLARPEIGDRLVFDRVGAYSVTEGIYLFLSRDMPRIYRSENGNLTLLRDVVHTHAINSTQK